MYPFLFVLGYEKKDKGIPDFGLAKVYVIAYNVNETVQAYCYTARFYACIRIWLYSSMR